MTGFCRRRIFRFDKADFSGITGRFFTEGFPHLTVKNPRLALKISRDAA
jgi:hypothetical protein